MPGDKISLQVVAVLAARDEIFMAFHIAGTPGDWACSSWSWPEWVNCPRRWACALEMPRI